MQHNFIIMSQSNMSEKQSLDIINDMLTNAKEEDAGGSAFYFILWGIIVMVFSVLTYYAIITKAAWQPWTYMLFLIGGIASFIRSKSDDKKEIAKSRYDRLYMFVWSGVGICLGLSWGFVALIGINNILPVSLLFYGLASFITGGVSRYYPSLIGSIICFVCVIFAFQTDFVHQNLICAFAVFCVHVIPGLMMNRYYKGKKRYAE